MDETSERPKPESQAPENRTRPPLSAAAKRALAEAEARRSEQAKTTRTPPREIDGRGGPDPARYGDWEVKGIASDF